jgi:hypothetical protein
MHTSAHKALRCLERDIPNLNLIHFYLNINIIHRNKARFFTLFSINRHKANRPVDDVFEAV